MDVVVIRGGLGIFEALLLVAAFVDLFLMDLEEVVFLALDVLDRREAGVGVEVTLFFREILLLVLGDDVAKVDDIEESLPQTNTDTDDADNSDIV